MGITLTSSAVPEVLDRVKVSEISVVELISTFEAKDEDPTVKALFTDASANDEAPEHLNHLQSCLTATDCH